MRIIEVYSTQKIDFENISTVFIVEKNYIESDVFEMISSNRKILLPYNSYRHTYVKVIIIRRVSVFEKEVEKQLIHMSVTQDIQIPHKYTKVVNV